MRTNPDWKAFSGQAWNAELAVFFKIAAYTQLYLSKPHPPPSPRLWQSPFHNRTDAGSRARVWRQGTVCAHGLTYADAPGPKLS